MFRRLFPGRRKKAAFAPLRGAILLFLIALPPGAAGYCEGCEHYQREAAALKLHEDPAWLTLVHYGGNGESSADGAIFFLSPQGRRDAKAELQATISAMLEPPGADPDEHARCRFPARYEWLNRRIGLSSPISCPGLEEWYASLQPSGLTLIFPAAFLNNPASAFGHTLIRIDQKGGLESTALLAYSANFAAETESDDALTYALKGLAGGYQGFFSIAPYYQKVREYSDLESRDIWEYKLKLTEPEVRAFILHLWELRGVPFDYYYFDENCSSQLTAAIDAAKPELRASSAFSGWVIPVDTIRAMEAIIGDAVYRPSSESRLRRRIALTERTLWPVAKQMVETREMEDLSSLAPEQRARLLDLAYEALAWERLRAGDDSERTKDFAYRLLSERSGIGAAVPESAVIPPTPPDRSHRSVKIAISGGGYDGRPVYQLEVRPALHDLLDPPQGYAPGSQILVGDLMLRQIEASPLKIQSFTLLDVTSLSPQSYFFRPWSWTVRTGVERREFREGDAYATFLSAGAGKTVGEEAGDFLAALLTARVELARPYDHDAAFGVGPLIHLAASEGERLGFLVTVDAKTFFAGSPSLRVDTRAEARLTLDANTSLRFGVSNERQYGHAPTLILLSVEKFL